MSPHSEGEKTGPCHIDKTVERKGGGGEGRQPPRSPHAQEKTLMIETLTKMPFKCDNALCHKSTRNPGACTYITNR